MSCSGKGGMSGSGRKEIQKRPHALVRGQLLNLAATKFNLPLQYFGIVESRGLFNDKVPSQSSHLIFKKVIMVK